ncbi:MAG TPA: hypothetical protein PKV71_08765 [Calditrichia bacterium]|nr:hypothetical protein [Calditrichia bacterium]
MNFGIYFRWSGLLFIFCALVSLLILRQYQDPGIRTAVGTGLGMAYLNTLIGFFVLAWGYRRQPKQLMVAVFGGMIFRFLLIFAALFVLIWALKMNQVALVTSLVAAYFLFLVLEIFHIVRNVDCKEGEQ